MNTLNIKKGRIFASLIAADLLNLQREIQLIDPYVDGYHIDIMDGHFVPNLTWGAMFVDAISSITTKSLWIHLMVDNPLWWIEILKMPDDTLVSFHIESIKGVELCVKSIKEKKWMPSLAVSPKTPISETFPFFNIVDHILIMSVDPGFSGQSFISHMQQKINPVLDAFCKRARIPKSGENRGTIAFDGGINLENIGTLFRQGVTDFAIANAIFASRNTRDAVIRLRELVE